MTTSTKELGLDDVLTEIEQLRGEIRRASRSPWVVGTVVAANTTTQKADVSIATSTGTKLLPGIDALGNYIPESGHQVIVLMNRDAPIVIPPAQPLTSAAPAQVTGLAVTPAIGALLISWAQIIEADVKWNRGYYQVQVATDAGFSSIVKSFDVAANTTVVSSLTTGTTYHVRVRAVDYVGQVGAYSSTVTGVPVSVGTVDLAPLSITTTLIADNAISTPKLQADSVTANEIAALTITGAEIAANTISGAKIFANTITAAKLVAATITANELAANSVTATQLAALSLSVGKFISSTTYSAGVSGWIINADGTAEFNNVTVRGTLVANTTMNSSTNVATNGGAETIPANTELVSNTGFETNATGWQAYLANMTVARGTTTPRTGVGQLTITRTTTTGNLEAGTATGTSGMVCAPGDGVQASGYVRASTSTRSWSIAVNFYNAAGTPTRSVIGSPITNSAASYGLRQVTAVAFAGEVFFSISMLTNSVCAIGESHLIDDMSAKVVANGGWGAFSLDSISRSTAQAHSGSASWLASAGGGIYHRIPVVGAASYALTWWLLRSTVDTNVGIYITYWDAAGVYIDIGTSITEEASVGTYFAGAAWSQSRYAFRTPANAAFAEIAFSGRDAAAAFYLDDAEIYRSTYVQGGYARPDVLVSKTDVYDAVGLTMPVGTVLPWAGSTSGLGSSYTWEDAEGSEAEFLRTSFAPPGWLIADGSAVSRATYWRLFAQIGTAWGAGDGSTTFNVPDLRGRIPVGLDNMGGTDAGRLSVANTLGGSGGHEKLQAHTHALGENSFFAGAQNEAVVAGGTGHYVRGGALGTLAALSTGAGSGENMPPYVLMNWIIKC